ncbi:MAG TPA: response regulator [Planctomycetota bacterium]|nr:response regulator [Planctomycetota bacterium]
MSSDPESAGTVLLVDDDENCRKLFQRVLRAKGWTVCGASNAREAASVYAAVRPDVVVTDLLMPGGDGNMLIAELQKLDPGVCIVAITGVSPKDPRVAKAIEGGAQRVLTKPFDGTTLINAIEHALHPTS